MKHEPRIVHVLADGTKVNSIKGMIVPQDNNAYAVMVEAAKSRGDKWQQLAS